MLQIGRRYPARRLSLCRPLLNVSPTVLSILQEKSPYKNPAEKRKKILILSPEETKDKTLSRFVEGYQKLPTGRKVVNDLDFEIASGPANIIETVENFKNARSRGSITSDINLAILTLQKSFTKSQLLQYVEGKKVPSKMKANKKTLSEYIVTNIWNEAPLAGDMVFSTRRIPLSHKEMFLLLLQKGALLSLLRSTVSTLDFDVEKQELVLVGTESQLQNASVNLQHKFDNVHTEEFDFTTIQTLYERKYGAFSFKDIGRLVEVNFSHLQGNTYELSAFNATQIKRIKRLLVWFLDFNLHARSHVHLPDLANTFLVPYSDVYGMAWKNRNRSHFRLSKEGTVLPSRTLLRELDSFSKEQLEFEDLDSEFDTPSELAQETYDILDSLGLSRGDLLADAGTADAESVENSAVIPDSVSDTVSDAVPVLSLEERDKIYDELVDFSYTKALHGVKSLDQPMFTVTLGHVLFDKAEDSGPTLSKSDLSDVGFNTNVPLVHDRTLSRALAGEATNLETDPHIYSLQFKFLPSPYVNQDLEERMKYPPIEVWMQLNENSTPDIESMQVVTVEGENNTYVCFPDKASDMKVTCQLTGRVLEPQSEDDTDTLEVENLESVLARTADKYPRLRKQAGIRQFLQELRLDFSGKKQTSVAASMNVEMEGKSIEYAFVSMNYRRELLVEIEENKTAQLSIVDGGLLGGRRVEVRFVGDFSAGLDRKSFDDLLDYSCRFINDL